MSLLDPNDTRRLRSSLARLASDHEGEVVAAASAASRILAKAGLGFADLGVAQVPEPARATAAPFVRRDVTEPAWGPRRRPHEVNLGRQHQVRAKLLLGSGHAWEEWEQGFLSSIAGWNSSLSVKQAKRLAELEAVRREWWEKNGGGK